MNPTPRHRHSWLERVVSLVVVGALATLPLWTQAWWTALPFAAALGGVVGGRWMRWFWALPVGFAAGALVWGLELALLPVAPRSRLTDVLAPAEGLSSALFLVIGPILFGLVAAVTGVAVSGALRLGSELRSGPPDSEGSPGTESAQ
jgi:hypothetical protein